MQSANHNLERTSESPDVSADSKPERSPRINNVPNFFIIGAVKSGTSALSEYLKSHPNIFFSSVKEPEFFSFDTQKRVKPNLETYLSLFSEAAPHLHKAVGEGSTGYLFSKVAVSEILKFNPNSKFIVVLRNPVEVVQALHSEMYFWGAENVRDFEKAWRLEEVRRNGRSIPNPWDDPKRLLYSEWARLGEQMERLFSVVHRDSVKVILFDDFVADTKGVYEDVLSFLGVPSDGKNDFPTVNENRALRYPWVQRGLAITFNHLRWILAATGLRWRMRWGLSRKLLLLNANSTTRKRISPELRAELSDFFRDDVRRLSELLGRDLSHWVSKSTNPNGSKNDESQSGRMAH